MLRFAGRRPRLGGIAKWICMTQRHRSGGPNRKSKPLHPSSSFQKFHAKRHFQQRNPSPRLPSRQRSPSTIPVIGEADAIPYFQSEVSYWAKKSDTVDRLVSFGLPKKDSRILLDHFAKTVESGGLSDASNFDYYQLSRFSKPHNPSSVDIIYSTIFFWWAAKCENRGWLENVGIQLGTLDSIKALVQATDRSFPADEFSSARRNHRTIILHVGPTNSGKTHHALRALAAAPSGVYAGPLRLLAHEIWERLNTGKIIPLGEDEPLHASEDKTPHIGNPKYNRPCNLVTGEEQRFMGDSIPLNSCTIEMLSCTRFYDVAIVDEIQMLGDPDRGNAWVNAVLGLNAREVHLCGEETAIPVVQEILKHTGDEIVIRRYERLSPLVVEDTSLEGELAKVQKGDCIVTFRRSAIFHLKRAVERKTGLRCAVVYGRLPPEVRSEQAALFNDPNSGYDVLIGSDAIGMGLNLKIKRIIFDAVSKWDGISQIPLPVSSVKQIAGRAGRFGLQDGGSVTTLYAEDLPYLKKCVAQPYEPLSCGYISHTQDLFAAISRILPHDTAISTALQAFGCIGRLPLALRYDSAEREAVCEFIDSSWTRMTIKERLTLLNAPIPWRDDDAVAIITRMLVKHQDELSVKLHQVMGGTPHYHTLLFEENNMEKKRASTKAFDSLARLETFHKVIVFYMWMSYRFPVSYADYVTASLLKGRVEKVLNWCLNNLTVKMDSRRGMNLVSLLPPVRASDSLSYMTRVELRRKAMLGSLM